MGGNPINAIDPYGLWAFGDPLPQGVVDFSAGFGDTLSFGATDWVRDQMGTNGVVNKCSGGYSAGEWAGTAHGFAAGGLGIAKSLGRSSARGITSSVAKGADDLVSVRHHTSPGGLKGIKIENAINPGRGNPPGVHVEVAPFGSAKTASAETGAFGKGAYVEFQVLKSSIKRTNVGPRNTGVIPSNSAVSLQGTSATFNKSFWWKFWD